MKRRFSIPFLRPLEDAVHTLSLTGKVILYTLVIVFCTSALGLLWNVNKLFLVDTPHNGGTLREGVVGLPRFVNPVLSVTDGDKDLVALVYSGLLKAMPDGTFMPDLAESYTISPDGRIYTFVLRKDATFHDGKPVTADDIVFTVEKIQDPTTKSPKQSNWDGITVQKVNDSEVRFILKQAYAAFLENTTLGILPAHALQNKTGEAFITDDINVNPIGSGPYKVDSIKRTSNGAPASYILVPFTHYLHGVPKISKLILSFYANEKNLVEAYRAHDIDSMNSIAPETAYELQNAGSTIIQAALPRTFAVFFNQESNRALAQKEVRQALNMSVDRALIVNSVFQGFASPLDSAVPKSFTSSTHSLSSIVSTSTVDDAIRLLDQQGWTPNATGIREKKIGKDTVPLSFSISTTDAPELKAVADILKTEWQKLGADVTIKVVEGGYLNQNIIKPRKYDALLFGQVVNKDLDLYAFWHSTQTEDPGLNVALYKNKSADIILERMRVTLDHNARIELYNQFDALLKKDMPAVFLFSPNFIYVVPDQFKDNVITEISVPSERFGTISSWYLITEKIWKLFLHS